MTMRSGFLRAVAARLPALDRPMLVAIDGVDGSGKTTLADELAAVLGADGRAVTRASVDGFHHPRTFRYAEGRSGETFWSRSYDYQAMTRVLLDPWRGGAGSAYRTAVHDVQTDQPIESPMHRVPPRGVLLVDGIFTQRDELASYWDFTIFLDVPFETSVARMARRDGSVPDVGDPGQARYIEGQRIYLVGCRPRERADLVVDNSDLLRPRFGRTPARPLSQKGNPRKTRAND